MSLSVVPVTTKGFLQAGQIIEIIGQPERNIRRLYAVAHMDKNDERTAHLCFPVKEATAEQMKKATENDEIVFLTARIHSITSKFSNTSPVNAPLAERPHIIDFDNPLVIIDRSAQKTVFTIHPGKDLGPTDELLIRKRMNEIIMSDIDTVQEYKKRFTQIGSSKEFSGVRLGADARRKTSPGQPIDRALDDDMGMEP